MSKSKAKRPEPSNDKRRELVQSKLELVIKMKKVQLEIARLDRKLVASGVVACW